MIKFEFGDINIGWFDDAYAYLKDKSQQAMFPFVRVSDPKRRS
jgi:hypothetical protein